MISSAPVIAANDLPTLEQKVKAFLVVAKAKAAAGLTVSECGELLFALLRLAMDTVDSVPADGAAKKQWVLDAVGMAFDDLADLCVPVYVWPAWLIVKPLVRQLVIAVASGAVESILPLVRIAAR